MRTSEIINLLLEILKLKSLEMLMLLTSLEVAYFQLINKFKNINNYMHPPVIWQLFGQMLTDEILLLEQQHAERVLEHIDVVLVYTVNKIGFGVLFSV